MATQTQQDLPTVPTSSVTTLPSSAHHQPSSVSEQFNLFVASMHMPETIFPHFFPRIIPFSSLGFSLIVSFIAKPFLSWPCYLN